MYYIDCYSSILGNITMASDGEKLTGLWFDGQKYFASTLNGDYVNKELPIFIKTKKWLDMYFKGVVPEFNIPILLEGSPFRMAVWQVLQSIPYGQTMTYGQIANLIASKKGIDKMSAQAVGGAVGHNPISIVVPCHRVIGVNSNLTGYAGGIDKKIALLKLEGVNTEKLHS